LVGPIVLIILTTCAITVNSVFCSSYYWYGYSD